MTPRQLLQQRNHTKKGAIVKADPLRSLVDVRKVRTILKDRVRDLAMFDVGINTALRGSDLVKLKKADVVHLKVGDHMTIRIRKNGDLLQITINEAAHDAIQRVIAWAPKSEWLFPSETQDKPITREYLGQMVKQWCKDAGLKGRFASHTLRKTFGVLQYFHFKVPLSIVSQLLGHKEERVTRVYLCIQEEQVKDAYLNVIR
jgi:integrase